MVTELSLEMFECSEVARCQVKRGSGAFEREELPEQKQ